MFYFLVKIFKNRATYKTRVNNVFMGPKCIRIEEVFNYRRRDWSKVYYYYFFLSAQSALARHYIHSFSHILLIFLAYSIYVNILSISLI
jgi:hypothetical protein